MEPQFADVLQGLAHLLHFAGRHEADGVPVPFIVENTVIEPDRPVRGDQMVWKNPLTSGQDVQLLGSLFEMHLRGYPISTLDINRGVPGQIHDEVSFPELIHSFFNGHHLKGAQLLGILELLHVEGAKARIVEAPGKDPKGVAHEDLVHPVAGHQVRG